MFQPDAWYDACDALGIMVYHDQMYAQQGHAPVANAVQDSEIRHQVRRLSHHPCIVMWDGCNECHVVINTPTGVYATFVMTVVAEEDASRAVWPSCPSDGWSAGVDRLTARPNGSPKGLLPAGQGKIETHGPYEHGSGFPSVNGPNSLVLFPSNLPITVTPTDTGPQHKNIFASEFGCVTFSSFESMSATLDEAHWSLHGGAPPDKCGIGFATVCKGNNTLAQRNYACDNLIQVYFGAAQRAAIDDVGEAAFKRQLYQCMLAQALEIKSNIETRRSTNEFGTIVWQYNEIWPTGGWGSIEYGSPGVAGQVTGGRWKPLQYFYKKSIYKDVMAACSGKDGACYVKNDGITAVSVRVTIHAVPFAGAGTPSSLFDQTISLPAGAGMTHFFTVPALASLDAGAHVAVATVADASSSGAVLSENVIALAPPAAMKGALPASPGVVATVQDAPPAADGSVGIELDTKGVALYVTLTTLAEGRFSDNAFLLTPAMGAVTIRFLPFGGAADVALLKKSLRVEHVAMYL